MFIWYILYNICFPYFLFFIIFHLVLNADFLYIMTSFQTSSVALSFKTGSGGALLADAPHRSLPCQRNLFGFVVRAHHCNRDIVYIVGFRLRRGKVDCRRVGHIHRLYTTLRRPHFMPSFYKEIKPHLLPPLVHPHGQWIKSFIDHRNTFAALAKRLRCSVLLSCIGSTIVLDRNARPGRKDYPMKSDTGTDPERTFEHDSLADDLRPRSWSMCVVACGRTLQTVGKHRAR